MDKKNCWEVKNCGRQLGGAKVKELGICPAASLNQLNGIHGGLNGGRACWALTGTLCASQVQGSFASKMKNCIGCIVYKMVIKEEGATNILSVRQIKEKLSL